MADVQIMIRLSRLIMLCTNRRGHGSCRLRVKRYMPALDKTTETWYLGLVIRARGKHTKTCVFTVIFS